MYSPGLSTSSQMRRVSHGKPRVYAASSSREHTSHLTVPSKNSTRCRSRIRANASRAFIPSTVTPTLTGRH